MNREDIEIDLDELKAFLTSTDLSTYSQLKSKFFGT
jgi:hypothetical protein